MNEVQSINSEITLLNKITSVEDIFNNLKKDTKYQVVVYLLSEIAFGDYYNGFQLLNNNLEYNNIEAIRIFNQDTELYCYRTNDINSTPPSTFLRGRVRTDSKGEHTYYKDVSQILMGKTNGQQVSGYSIIREARGFQLTLPYSWIKNYPDNSRVTLLTRNYLEHWDNGQLSYFDHRFVRIGETDREE